jgi:hypothetical protein
MMDKAELTQTIGSASQLAFGPEEAIRLILLNRREGTLWFTTDAPEWNGDSGLDAVLSELSRRFQISDYRLQFHLLHQNKRQVSGSADLCCDISPLSEDLLVEVILYLQRMCYRLSDWRCFSQK